MRGRRGGRGKAGRSGVAGSGSSLGDSLGRCTYQLSLIAPFCQPPPPVSHQNVFVKDSFTKLLTTNVRPHSRPHLRVPAVCYCHRCSGCCCCCCGRSLAAF
ncbi:hypothetical protein E2C01_007959 [Portunus trituberculatus]|uniref:Uncharacterized protein n=1 Tax=Portunus trituberculatus TaxID=210409 RepID=A0A5B7D1I3_PORTR|nr:hypothetical protein [Portunus trituberculatus]